MSKIHLSAQHWLDAQIWAAKQGLLFWLSACMLALVMGGGLLLVSHISGENQALQTQLSAPNVGGRGAGNASYPKGVGKIHRPGLSTASAPCNNAPNKIKYIFYTFAYGKICRMCRAYAAMAIKYHSMRAH